MSSRMRLARRWKDCCILSLWLLAACASRAVPESVPQSSAASTQAPEARPHPVTRALSEDPPLPGATSSGWEGLQAPADSQHQHHGSHPGTTPAAPAHSHAATPAPAERNETTPSGVRYACPMHPDVVSPEPGRCPRCGMQLVLRP
jgi:heavy metal-binding protein